MTRTYRFTLTFGTMGLIGVLLLVIGARGLPLFLGMLLVFLPAVGIVFVLARKISPPALQLSGPAVLDLKSNTPPP
jgi:hypothetical protein